jgi:hypothetical protein
MPAYQSLWFDDYQGLFPIAEARPEDETDTDRVVQSSRLDLSLRIEGQLLSQEQDLRAQGCVTRVGITKADGWWWKTWTA